MADSARVFEEIRQEQEHTQHVEKARKQLEIQVKKLFDIFCLFLKILY